MPPKFTLPSPKLDKICDETCNLRYLTPSGMTLLPRAKQPPSMYGARGSTLPAKFIKQDRMSIKNTLDTLVTPLAPTEYCGNCCVELSTAQDTYRHLKQHETCPAKNCSFAALGCIVERHIEANHLTGLYKTVKKVWSPEDISAWRAERCKRFPTASNVKIAKLAKEQRFRRGERLEASKLRFSKRGDRRYTRKQIITKERTLKKKYQSKPDTSSKLVLKNGNSFITNCLFMFCGTNQLIEYKHVKTKSIFKQDALSNILALYGTDSEYENESYNCDNANVAVGNSRSIDTTVAPKICKSNNLKVYIDSNQLVKDAPNSSSDEPEEQGIDRIIEKDLVYSGQQEMELVSLTYNMQQSSESAFKFCGPEKYSTLNYKLAHKANRQSTMLSKLMASEIQHERNVLLQCVRYVCEQNFFSIGIKETSPMTKPSDNKNK